MRPTDPLLMSESRATNRAPHRACTALPTAHPTMFVSAPMSMTGRRLRQRRGSRALVFWGIACLALFLARVASAEPPGKPKHWAFQPVVRPSLPAVGDSRWCRTTVDYFILAKLEQQKLAP